MVGDGGERKLLERLTAELGISTEVTFWGQQLDVAPFFSAADAFIMSSNSEGLPISLLQAFSLGLPAIVTDVGGMAEVVRLARAGFTVSASDPTELAASIVRMASSPTELQEFSKNAEAAFRGRFTLPGMVDAYINLYGHARRFRRTINT
jgi:glycosyltransferase involved in cell wall biosynthesis